MTISVFNLFSIGIGPSSSHTVGPMKAARAFVSELQEHGKLTATSRLTTELFGSLAFTGKGHGTDAAILLGLEGNLPDTVDPAIIKPRAEAITQEHNINLLGIHQSHFDYAADMIYNFKDLLPAHTNAMRFTAYDAEQNKLSEGVYYSIGGGFILTAEEALHPESVATYHFPYDFSNAKTLLSLCEQNKMSISELMLANETSIRSAAEVNDGILKIAQVMQDCIAKGCETGGILPGGLNVKRRAHQLHQKLLAKGKPKTYEHMDSMEWLNLFAIAVNEENAAGGRVVTAPTNGAAGIIPAVLHYYLTFYPNAKSEDAITFLLTAGAIGILYKKGASISGAEVGCQGEVGVACSMAAAALTAVLGGTQSLHTNALDEAIALPTDFSEATGINSVIGNERSFNTSNMTFPTIPVAPTTATLITKKLLTKIILKVQKVKSSDSYRNGRHAKGLN